MSQTLFEKIISREIPADIVFEDELCLAFRDISPQAPVHVLLIPKKPIPSVDAIDETDSRIAESFMASDSPIGRRVAADRWLPGGGELWRGWRANGRPPALPHSWRPLAELATWINVLAASNVEYRLV